MQTKAQTVKRLKEVIKKYMDACKQQKMTQENKNKQDRFRMQPTQNTQTNNEQKQKQLFQKNYQIMAPDHQLDFKQRRRKYQWQQLFSQKGQRKQRIIENKVIYDAQSDSDSEILKNYKQFFFKFGRVYFRYRNYKTQQKSRTYLKLIHIDQQKGNRIRCSKIIYNSFPNPQKYFKIHQKDKRRFNHVHGQAVSKILSQITPNTSIEVTYSYFSLNQYDRDQTNKLFLTYDQNSPMFIQQNNRNQSYIMDIYNHFPYAQIPKIKIRGNRISNQQKFRKYKEEQQYYRRFINKGYREQQSNIKFQLEQIPQKCIICQKLGLNKNQCKQCNLKVLYVSQSVQLFFGLKLDHETIKKLRIMQFLQFLTYYKQKNQ